MTMISVCPEVSTLMDVGASPPGQRSTERFHSGLASCLCLQGGQCLPNWENCWQDKWSHRALDAADYTGTLQASKTNTGTRGHQSHLCSGTCSLHISLGNLSLFLTTSGLEHWEKLGAEGEANLPKHSLILLALPAWWKRWRAVLRFQEDTSSSPASPELKLGHCHTWALYQFSLITSVTSTEKSTRDKLTEVSLGHAFTLPEDINFFILEHNSLQNNFNGSYGLTKNACEYSWSLWNSEGSNCIINVISLLRCLCCWHGETRFELHIQKKKIKYPNTLLLKMHRDLLLMRKCGFVCVCSFLAISHQSKWQLVFLLFSLLIKLAILDFG